MRVEIGSRQALLSRENEVSTNGTEEVRQLMLNQNRKRIAHLFSW